VSTPGLRVIKLGGSLLDLNGLADRLQSWLAAQSPMRSLIIVGGGRLADEIRSACERHDLDDATAHWLCVGLLGVTSELVHRLLPGWRLVRRYEELPAALAVDKPVLFDTEQFLRETEPMLPGTALPQSWDATSDSIAARVAAVLDADELVLLKSSLPEAATISEMSQSGYVDRFFPTAAAGLRSVRAVNLRGDGFPEVRLRAGA
jgi:aspartokinase-like uncharacterized kinase